MQGQCHDESEPKIFPSEVEKVTLSQKMGKLTGQAKNVKLDNLLYSI